MGQEYDPSPTLLALLSSSAFLAIVATFPFYFLLFTLRLTERNSAQPQSTMLEAGVAGGELANPMRDAHGHDDFPSFFFVFKTLKTPGK